MRYRVYGHTDITLSTVVEADSEEEAYEKAEFEFGGIDNYAGFGDCDHLIGVAGIDDTIASDGYVQWDDCEEEEYD